MGIVLCENYFGKEGVWDFPDKYLSNIFLGKVQTESSCYI